MIESQVLEIAQYFEISDDFNIVLIREKFSETLGRDKNTLMGYMWIKGLPFCWRTLENWQRHIPDGQYTVEFTYSPKFSKKMPYEIFDGKVPEIRVKGRSGIRIHVGNQWRDTTGCILIGDSTSLKNSDYIINSAQSYKNFMSLVRKYNYTKSIITVQTMK